LRFFVTDASRVEQLLGVQAKSGVTITVGRSEGPHFRSGADDVLYLGRWTHSGRRNSSCPNGYAR